MAKSTMYRVYFHMNTSEDNDTTTIQAFYRSEQRAKEVGLPALAQQLWEMFLDGGAEINLLTDENITKYRWLMTNNGKENFPLCFFTAEEMEEIFAFDLTLRPKLLAQLEREALNTDNYLEAWNYILETWEPGTPIAAVKWYCYWYNSEEPTYCGVEETELDEEEYSV